MKRRSALIQTARRKERSLLPFVVGAFIALPVALTVGVAVTQVFAKLQAALQAVL